VFLVDADGAHLTKLTDGSTRYCDPSVTPDGRHILLSSDRAHPGGDSDLYVMNPDGSGVTRLTHEPDRWPGPLRNPRATSGAGLLQRLQDAGAGRLPASDGHESHQAARDRAGQSAASDSVGQVVDCDAQLPHMSYHT
jgi:WD40 repeat protein